MAVYNSPWTSREWDRASEEQNRQVEESMNLNRAKLGLSYNDSLLTPEGRKMVEQTKANSNLPQDLASMFKREADPYSAQRDQVINDPSGALNNSPFFKFMREKYMNNATAKNAAGGLRNSGRGLMALGEAGQKASADYLFPYLQALGRPQSGANAFFEAYKFMNTPKGGGGGGFRQPAAPRQSLSMVGAPAASAPALPSGGAAPYSEYSGWVNPNGPGMDKAGNYLPGYGPAAGAGTGTWMNDQTLAGGYFNNDREY